MTLNEQISKLNQQLSKEKSTVSCLLEEKKRLKSDFKTCEDELLDKQILLEKKIKELNNIVLKTGQSIQMIHMLSPKPNSFYHTEQKMALCYQNPFYLKQAQKKQQSLYDGKVLLAKHDPIVVHDSEETLQLAQESREKMKQMDKEIKPANYTKINHLSGEADAFLAKHKILELEIERLLKAVVSQDIISVVQNASVVDTSDLQTELECTKERFENCIIKKENEYAKLWNNWKHKSNVSKNETQQKSLPEIMKPKKVGFIKRLATPKPRKTRFLLRWSPTGRLFEQDGKLVASSKFESQVDFSNGDNACNSNAMEPKIKRFPNSTSLLCCSKHMTGNLKLLINFVWKFIGTVRFGNDHVAAILGFGDL
nr:integrase, catalytic region, zinc finger, CCHC-type, peptidase aspartic, catalytic [Tanacetum cinerariifolium]